MTIGKKSHQSLFGINLILIWLFGVSALTWILFYTDWFPEVGGVLALGGVFSWFAFVAKILPDDRIKGMQAWLDHNLLSRWPVTIALLVLIAVEFIWTGHRGALRIQSLQEATDRVVRVYSAGAMIDGPLQLPTRGDLHVPLATNSGSPLNLVLKVSGFPDKQLILGPRHIARLYVPDSFMRPVVLLRPTVELVASVANNPAKLYVIVGSHTATIASFTGQAVWVGCDDDVDIPQALQDAWRVELAAQRKAELVHNWLNPEAAVFAGQPRLELLPRQRIQVMEEGMPQPLKVITVKPIEARSSFPQVEDLDVPKN